jgi:outer membrane scaffolding protein for murein synthesis (MipA/OmpV family)
MPFGRTREPLINSMPCRGLPFRAGQGARSVVYWMYTSDEQRRHARKGKPPEGLPPILRHAALLAPHVLRVHVVARALPGAKWGATAGHGIDQRLPSTGTSRALALCCLLALACAFIGSARAQTPSPLGEWQYSAGVVLKKRFDPNPPHWEYLLGFGGEYLPRFEGSDNYYFEPGPTIDIRYRDLAFFSTGEGLGVNLLRGTNYRAGLALTYDLGRNEGNYYRLRGRTNLSPSAAPKLFIDYVIFPVILRGDVRHNLGGVGGWIGDASVYMPVMGSNKFFVFAGASVTLADKNYMRHAFGVDEQASLNTHLPVYTPGGGVKSAGVGTNMTYIVADHWFLDGVFAATTLLGEAGNSPTVNTKWQYAASLSVAYDFR